MRPAEVSFQVDGSLHSAALCRHEENLLVVLLWFAKVEAVDCVEHLRLVGGERDRVYRTELVRVGLMQQVALQVEAFDAKVLAIGHAQHAFLFVQGERVRYDEVSGRVGHIARPLSQVLAAFAELDYARVAVAVGHKELARAQHGYVGRLTQMCPVVAWHQLLADFEQRLQLVVRRELENLKCHKIDFVFVEYI